MKRSIIISKLQSIGRNTDRLKHKSNEELREIMEENRTAIDKRAAEIAVREEQAVRDRQARELRLRRRQKRLAREASHETHQRALEVEFSRNFKPLPAIRTVGIKIVTVESSRIVGFLREEKNRFIREGDQVAREILEYFGSLGVTV